MKNPQTKNKRAVRGTKTKTKPKRGARSRDKAAAHGVGAQNVNPATVRGLLQDPAWLRGWDPELTPEEAAEVERLAALPGPSGSSSDDTNESAPGSDRESPDRPAQNNERPAKAGEHREDSR